MEQEVIDAYKKAGNIAAQARDYGASLIKIGSKILDVTKEVEKKILELGGEFAFPPQISINDVAAHYCAHHDDITVFEEGDVVKIDVGVHIEGYVGDTARTVVLSDNPELNRLKDASKEALDNALKIVKPGVPLNKIGKVIHDTITEKGFAPVRNLSGHGLARFVIHDSPSIPNFDNGNDEVLHEGDVVAIEPFASKGAGIIYESGNPSIFSVNGKKPVRSSMTREVLKEIEKYNTLPFASRWLVEKFGPGKVSFALRELKVIGLLKEYPPLPDQSHGFVSQAEHTIIVADKPIITTLISKD